MKIACRAAQGWGKQVSKTRNMSETSCEVEWRCFFSHCQAVAARCCGLGYKSKVVKVNCKAALQMHLCGEYGSGPGTKQTRTRPTNRRTNAKTTPKTGPNKHPHRPLIFSTLAYDKHLLAKRWNMASAYTYACAKAKPVNCLSDSCKVISCRVEICGPLVESMKVHKEGSWMMLPYAVWRNVHF